MPNPCKRQSRISLRLLSNCVLQAAAVGAPAWPANVAAWLMFNSMRMEGLQFLQLNKQELENIWSKKVTADLRPCLPFPF